MKKLKSIFMLISTLLVLLSSNVLASVSRTDFESAISSFANSMNDTGYRFETAKDDEHEFINLGYRNRTARSEVYKKDDGTYDTAMYFTDDSFIAYIYHEVMGLDMMNGLNVAEQKDIYNDIRNDRSAPFNYFDYIGARGEIEIWDDSTGRVISDLKPGDILIEKVFGGYGLVRMYIGDNKIAYFENNTVKIVDAVSVKNKKFDVARIRDSELSRVSSLKRTFDFRSVETDATTMSDAIQNLDLVVNIENRNFVFSNSSGDSVTRQQITQAIKEGFVSEYGDVDDLFRYIYFQLEYRDERGNRRVFGGQVYENALCGTLNKNDTSSNDYVKIEVDMFDLEEYKYSMILYWGADYFLQTKHDLYLGIYVCKSGTSTYIPVGNSIPIANGEEQGGSILCFSEIVDYSDELGRNPTLQDFLDIELEMPEETYELQFSNIGDVQTIEKENGQYKRNELDEILFTVNKNGTYVIKITPEGGETLKSILIFLGKIEAGSSGIIGYGVHGQVKIRRAGVKDTGVCKDSDCLDHSYDLGKYIPDKDKNVFPLIRDKIYVINTSQLWGINIDDCTFEVEYLNDAIVEIRDHELERQGSFLDSQANFGVAEVHTGGIEEVDRN